MDINPFDFMLSDETLYDHFSEKVKKMLLPFGKNKAGCLICYWLSSKNTDECPIVWIDSEGEPNVVFATNLFVFFSLLPYGTGAIYDMIIAVERYIQNPESNQSISGLNEEPSAQDQESEGAALERKLNELSGVKTVNDPVELIMKAYQEFYQITKIINENRV